MTDSQLRQTLLSKLGISPQAMYQRAARVKRDYGPMSTEDAIYWLAVDEGLDVSRFLDKSSTDRVRELRRAAHRPAPANEPRRAPRSNQPRNVPRAITVGGTKLADPILPAQILEDARRMAETAYPLVYVFENSVREVIKLLMAKAFGDDWWEKKVADSVRRKTQGRIDDEEHNAWHGRRGSHPVYYTNIGDLAKIVVANWPQFEQILPNQGWFTSRINEIELSRNVLEHNNPLQNRDLQRLRLYLTDWQDQIASKRRMIV